ncbi:Uncharacterised protein [BD1-7 clade bacterium]|uniref:Lipoprotein n=1 Tax=BD1-7 clade bacterium TaxID=2029982 RepID=A0A5S9PDZ1_9GAMM|nr:Uncharacterised protein [BD1-7 clade bacterium]
MQYRVPTTALLLSTLFSVLLVGCGKSPAPDTDSNPPTAQPPAMADTTQGNTDADDITGVMLFDTVVPVSCDKDANTLAKSKTRLEDSGAMINNSQCAQLSDAAFTAVCGSPTGKFFIHEITAEGIGSAQQAKFQQLDDITEDSFFGTFKDPSGNVEYTVVECEQAN